METRPIAINRVLGANSDGRTDGRTDEVAFRVACTRLKIKTYKVTQSTVDSSCVYCIEKEIPFERIATV